MKILMVNKFLYPNGGSETYMLKLGAYLQSAGHEVQYFGMEHDGRCVGNRLNMYTSDMDFHSGGKLQKLCYPIKAIYSSEARNKTRLVLDDFAPDIVHLNNFNYQLTPSVIMEVVRWRKTNKKKCGIFYTAHDYQLICPNHLLYNPKTHGCCEKCISGHFINCAKSRCIHGSIAKSLIGSAEAQFWNKTGAYKHIDAIICCSEFLKNKMDMNPIFKTRTIALHNFIDSIHHSEWLKKEYVLYFGRFSEEKGIRTLVKACRELPDIPFIFAGSGSLDTLLMDIPNIRNVGFQHGAPLAKLIGEARFSIYPSEWYENCPLSVMESQMYGTPVLGADIGGIPELIDVGRTGEMFKSGDLNDLKAKIIALYYDKGKNGRYSVNCTELPFDTIDRYCDKLLGIYLAKANSSEE
ncbi:MAG: glycosyltransferase family 4 protein [Clostridiales Family XIII bacterium]|jgi:glycosyltransferase involved in cell wall biosynthesis|nr:glycosyltransferase family 4 protein [Clostridiales Family XIII bacterium]